jgi:hypothetical protein
VPVALTGRAALLLEPSALPIVTVGLAELFDKRLLLDAAPPGDGAKTQDP